MGPAALLRLLIIYRFYWCQIPRYDFLSKFKLLSRNSHGMSTSTTQVDLAIIVEPYGDKTTWLEGEEGWKWTSWDALMHLRRLCWWWRWKWCYPYDLMGTTSGTPWRPARLLCCILPLWSWIILGQVDTSDTRVPNPMDWTATKTWQGRSRSGYFENAKFWFWVLNESLNMP